MGMWAVSTGPQVTILLDKEMTDCSWYLFFCNQLFKKTPLHCYYLLLGFLVTWFGPLRASYVFDMFDKMFYIFYRAF